MIDNQQENDFEYNDGLGDLLREKEKREFSWLKTSIVMLIIIVISIFTVKLIFSLFKPLFIKSKSRTIHETTITSDDFHEYVSKKEKNESTYTRSKTKETQKGYPGSQKATSKKSDIKAKAVVVNETLMEKGKAKSSKEAQYKLIAGTFSKASNANRYCKRLNNKNIDCFIWRHTVNNKDLYLVQVGSFKKHSQASGKSKELKDKGIDSYIIKK
ncbi:MAG: SPOR domain-containing protein [bacterium]|nr:SPOR domain-containing protein [bacterium]